MAVYLTAVAFAMIFGIVFLRTPAPVLASLVKIVVLMALVVGGAILIFAKQFALGTPMFFAGIYLWRRSRERNRNKNAPHREQFTSVRSAAFEMELDQNQIALNGVVLVGSYEGRILDELSLPDLLKIRAEVIEDDISLTLLDTYLDGRFSGWRENA